MTVMLTLEKNMLLRNKSVSWGRVCVVRPCWIEFLQSVIGAMAFK